MCLIRVVAIWITAAALVVSAGCAGGGDHASSTGAPAAQGAGIARADVEAPSATSAPAPTTGAVFDPGTPVAFTLRALDADGAVAPAGAPPKRWAFDVDAAQFPPRALDPVLMVGDVALTQYRYMPDGALRFTSAPGQRLAAGAEVWIQYGEATSTRRVLTRALELGVSP